MGMTLSDYLQTHQLTRTDAAQAFGVSVEAVRLWLAGARTPRPEQMRRIIAATNGLVTANDFLSEQEPAR